MITTAVIIIRRSHWSPRENGGGYDAPKDLHSRTGRDETKGKTQEKMERGSRKRSSNAGSEKMERVGGR